MKLSQSTAKSIYIKTLNGKVISLSVDSTDSIYDLKRKIFEKQGIPIGNQRLIFTGQSLLDALTLSDYNIFDGCTLQIVFKVYVIIIMICMFKQIINLCCCCFLCIPSSHRPSELNEDKNNNEDQYTLDMMSFANISDKQYKEQIKDNTDDANDNSMKTQYSMFAVQKAAAKL